jgi:PUA domain protein
MFKKIIDVGNQVQLTKTDLKDVKKGLTSAFPGLEPYMEEILPKKAVFYGMRLKSNEKADLYIYDGNIICFKKGKEYIPTLWLLHQYPFILPKYQVDKGAIKFVLSGANIMCPGLTSPGAKMEDVDVGALVAIHAEGKEHAIAIGITTMSTKDIRTINKDIGVNNVHYVGDDLWKLEVAN